MTKQIDELAAKLTKAVKAANAAEETVTSAKETLVSRSREVGMLLLEAKKLHPVVKDFESFLKRVDGLQLSRAYDLMRLAGGRATEEEIRKSTRDRVKKHRDSKKLPGPAPASKGPEANPEPKPVSVTRPDVTESAEESAAKRRAANADLNLTAEERVVKESARYLAEFTAACRMYLPKITAEADRQKARLLVSELTTSKRKAA